MAALPLSDALSPALPGVSQDLGPALPGDFVKRRDPRVTDRTSSVSGVAERYASAMFDLAREESAIPRIEADLTTLSAMLDGSADLRRLVQSPVFSAEDQERAIGAVADNAGIRGLTGNFLRLVARNRRLFALPGIIKAFREMAARATRRGHRRGHLGASLERGAARGPQGRAARKARQGRERSICASIRRCSAGSS